MADVEVGGETYELAAGEFPPFVFMELSKAIADQAEGIESAGGDANAAMYRVVQACIADSDWGRFSRYLRGLPASELGEVTKIVAEARMAHQGAPPTSLPSASADGQTVIEAKSGTDFDPKLWEASNGRVDIYNGLKQSRAS